MKKSKSKKEPPQNKPEECCSGLAVFGGITLTLLVAAGLAIGVRYLINVHPEHGKCYSNSEDVGVYAKVYNVYNDSVSYWTVGGWFSHGQEKLERSVDEFQDRYNHEIDCVKYDAKVMAEDIENLQDRVISLEHKQVKEQRYYINDKSGK